MTIPAQEQRLLDSLPGDRRAIRTAWRYGCLYGRYQAMRAASQAVHDLPSLFPIGQVEEDELEKAIGELQRELHTWDEEAT